MKVAAVLATVLVGGLFAGCQDVSKGPPPAGTTLYEVTPRVVGTEYVFKTTTAENELSYAVRIAGISEHQGRQTYEYVRDDRRSFHDVATNNWIATLKDDQMIRSAAPYREVYQWPLWVGKKYRGTYDYTDHERNRTWYGTAPFWEVEAVETITVPAGTFETLRIQSGPGKGVGFEETHWYSPELGIDVKQKYRRTSNNFRGGGGDRETVLMAVTPPSGT